jgi:hypothetical protein
MGSRHCRWRCRTQREELQGRVLHGASRAARASQVNDLFPQPWMIHVLPDSQCNLALDDTVAGVHYECRWDAKTGKTTVVFR